MSYTALLDRTVSVLPGAVTGTDSRGNDVVTYGPPIGPYRAGRDTTDPTEDTRARDQQVRRFVYFLPRGIPLTPYDRIVDTDGVFRLDGDPKRIVRRRGGREHHVEAKVYEVLG